MEEHLGDGTYVVHAELPGVGPDKDVEITVDDGLLTLRAERIEQTNEMHRTEFRYGTLVRAVRLPAGAQDEEAAAAYKDGVLTLVVPVPEAKTGTRAIPVQHV
ncbi:Hsp20/alpha crystallin family protein [Streptomyces sp. NPDC004830]